MALVIPSSTLCGSAVKVSPFQNALGVLVVFFPGLLKAKKEVLPFLG